MAVNVLYGSTAQLFKVSADRAERAAAAERWGVAIGEGLLDVSEGLETPQAALARVGLGTLATHARLLVTSARDQELSNGNGRVHASWLRVGGGDFSKVKHWLDDTYLAHKPFMQQLAAYVDGEDDALDFPKLFGDPCAPVCRAYN
jgi:hypothetical protein